MKKIVMEDSSGKILKFQKESALKSKTAVLMLHGFPGIKTGQNEDLAKFLSNKFPLPFYLLHYSGLGKAGGNFSFLSSIEQGRVALKKLTENYNDIIIIGHSWGGLVAQNLFWENPALISKMILLSPLSEIPVTETAKFVIEEEMQANPELFGDLSEHDLLNELENIRKNNEPIKLAFNKKIKTNSVFVIQAKKDSEVSPEVSKRLIQILGQNAQYIELNQDHNFLENREELFDSVAELINL